VDISIPSTPKTKCAFTIDRLSYSKMFTHHLFALTTMKMSWFLASWFIAEEQLIQQETSGVVSHISSGVPNYLALFMPHLFVQQTTPVLSVWRMHKEQRPFYIRQVLCFVARPGGDGDGCHYGKRRVVSQRLGLVYANSVSELLIQFWA